MSIFERLFLQTTVLYIVIVLCVIKPAGKIYPTLCTPVVDKIVCIQNGGGGSMVIGFDIKF